MKVKILYEDKEGFVKYNEEDQEVSIDFPDEEMADEIERFLTSHRAFRIPESDRIDDFRVDYAYPYEERTYFELAMCELFSETGVWVNW